MFRFMNKIVYGILLFLLGCQSKAEIRDLNGIINISDIW